MKATKRVFVPVFLILFPSLLLANLPNEIDHPTYESQYRNSQTQSLRDRANANQLLEIVRSTESQINQNESDVAAAQNEIGEAHRNISELESDSLRRRNDNSQLSRENQNLSSSIRSTDQERASSQTSLDNLARRYNIEQRQLEQFRQRLEELRIQVDRSDREVQIKRGEIRKIEIVLEEVRNQVIELNQEKVSISSKITNLEAQKDKLERAVTQAEAQLQNLRNEVNQAQSNVQRLEREASTLKNQRDQAKAQLDAASRGLDPLRNKISAVKGEINQLNSTKSSLESKLSQNQSEINKKRTELSQSESVISNLESKISQTRAEASNYDQEVSALGTKKARFESEVSRIEGEIRSLQSGPQSPEVQNQIRKLQNEKLSNETRIRGIEGEMATALKNKERALRQIDNMEKQIAQVRGSQSTLQREISSLESERPRLQSQISSVQQDISSKSSELSRLETEYANASRSFAGLEQAYQTAQAQYNSKLNEVSTAQNQLRMAQKRLQDVQEDINQAKSKIADIQRELPQLSRRLSTIENDVRDLKQKGDRLRQQLPNLENELQRAEQRYAADLRDYQQSQRLTDNQERIVNSLSMELSQMDQVVRDLNQRLQQLRNQLSQNENQISVNESTMARNAQSVQAYERQITSLELQIDQSQREMARLNKDLIQQQQAYQAADRVALASESKTQSDYQEWQKRLTLYRQYFSEAQSLGANQAQGLATQKGQEKGELLVSQEGQSIGTRIGLEMALLDGQERGLIRGKLLGFEEGYKKGTESEEDFNHGHALGMIIGRDNAKAEALKVDFPIGYNEKKNELLRDIPRNLITLDNQKRVDFVSLTDSSLEKGFEKSDETDISDEERERANSFESQIDEALRKVEVALEEYSQASRNLSDASYVYQNPQNIVVVKDDQDCSQVYKGIADFVSACANSYDNSFKNFYSLSHKESYFAGYSRFYQNARNLSFASHRNDRFQASKTDSYKIVFAESFVKGAAVAEQNGKLAGIEEGYNQNIGQARIEAKAQGTQAAGEFFNRNGVTRVRAGTTGTLIEARDPRGLLQGSEISLGLLLSNLGKQAQQRGAVSMTIQSLSDNITLQNSKATLTELPARSNIDLKNIVLGKVKDNARPGSDITVQAILVYPGDQLASSYKEAVTFRAQVKVNPEVQSALEIDRNPEWRKWTIFPVKWKFRSHEVKIKLQGLRDFVPNGYQVKMSVLEGSKYVDLDVATVKTKPLAKDETTTAVLQYTFREKAKNATLSFKIEVSYEGEVLKSEVVKLQVQ